MKIFIKLSLVISLSVLLFIICLPHDTWLESENREISKLSFSDAAFCDRLPLRQSLLEFNRDLTLSLGINEYSGAFWGKNGYIFSNEAVSRDILEKNIEAYKAFEKSSGINTHFAPVGSKLDVLLHLLPSLYANNRSELWQNDGYNADILPLLRLKGGEGKYIYYRGDHHLTSLGSYYLYLSLANALGYTPYGASDFSPCVVKSDFSGSDARKLLTLSNDRIVLFRYKGDGNLLTENLDSGESFLGMYDYDKLSSENPYGVFPIPDCGRVRITLSGAIRDKLLIICDSYGDSLAPFLARHFDLDIIDPRYYGGSVFELLKENKYASVLFCFGMDTLAGREVLYKINLQ